MPWPLFAFMQKDENHYYTCLYQIQPKAFQRSIADAGIVCGAHAYTFLQVIYHLRDDHKIPLDQQHYCGKLSFFSPKTLPTMVFYSFSRMLHVISHHL